MTREEAIYYLQSSGFSEEQIRTIEQAFTCKDAISRQAAIDAIDKWVKAEHILATLPTDKVTPLFKSVHKLPPVNPQKNIVNNGTMNITL